MIFWSLAVSWLLLMYILFAGATLNVDIDKNDMVRFEGNAWQALVAIPFGSLYAAGDYFEQPRRSTLTLYEDERRLGPAHALHKKIRIKGSGAYAHWRERIIFSASDNSDAPSNGRRYWYRANFTIQEPLRDWLLLVAWVSGVLLVAAICARLHHNGVAVRPIAGVSLLALFGAVLLPHTEGVVFVALLAIISTAAVFVLASVLLATQFATGCGKGSSIPANVSLLLGSIGLVAILVERGLGLVESFRLNHAPIAPHEQLQAKGAEHDLTGFVSKDVRKRVGERRQYLTMPKQWKRREVDVAGAQQAYFWHDVLHIFNENFMRRIGDFPSKDPRLFRIMIVGDSLTYGVGLEEQWTYPKVLERKLRDKYAVEILNLGIPGWQSDDILNVVKRFYDELQPNLVVYGICLNDFLNSREGQYVAPFFEMPEFLKRRSKLFKFLDNKISAAARQFGASMDFYDDILKDIKNYQKRFTHDVFEMNAFVRSREGPPIVAIVLDHQPEYGGRGYRLANIAERAAHRAGMRVVESDEYFQEFHGQTFKISKWEGHPNEIAHEIFSSMLAEEIANCCGIENYVREPPSEE